MLTIHKPHRKPKHNSHGQVNAETKHCRTQSHHEAAGDDDWPTTFGICDCSPNIAGERRMVGVSKGESKEEVKRNRKTEGGREGEGERKKGEKGERNRKEGEKGERNRKEGEGGGREQKGR